MQVREQTKTAIFGISIIALIVVSVNATAAINFNANEVEHLYKPVFLTILITGLFINVLLGIFGAFIVYSLNSFLTKNLPNLIGVYQRIKILAILQLLNTVPMTIVTIWMMYATDILYHKSFQDLIYWSILVFIVQIYVLFACWFIHPDLTNSKHRNIINQIIKEQTEQRQMFV